MDLNGKNNDRFFQLNELDEMRQESFQHIDLISRGKGGTIESLRRNNSRKVSGYSCSIQYLRTSKGKFNTRYLGPYEIEVVFDNGYVNIRIINDEKFSLLVNGPRLKLYQKPKYKGEFIKGIMKQDEMHVVGEGVSPHPSSS